VNEQVDVPTGTYDEAEFLRDIEPFNRAGFAVGIVAHEPLPTRPVNSISWPRRTVGSTFALIACKLAEDCGSDPFATKHQASLPFPGVSLTLSRIEIQACPLCVTSAFR
jgi:hypothetical protein